jgi:hypothetical protein
MLIADGDGGRFDRVLRLRLGWGELTESDSADDDGRLSIGVEERLLPDIGRGRGTGAGQLNNTHGLSVDECDRVWVSDRANGRIQVMKRSF